MKNAETTRDSKKKSTVYLLSWDRRNDLEKLIDKSRAVDFIEKNDLVAVKMHFGEINDDGHIRPEFVRPVLKAIRKRKGRPFLTDANTIYHGPRNNAVDHLRVAADHGFSQTRLQVPVIISDGLLGNDHEEIEINGKHFEKVKIAAAIRHADKIFALSHFKGHLLAGLGGAVKNIGMGCGSKRGKFEMHCTVAPTVEPKKCVACGLCVGRCAHGALSIVNGRIGLDKQLCRGCGDCIIACHTGALTITWNEGSIGVQERLVEYALGALKDKPAFYMNFLNHITPNCDCMGMKEKPLLPDIGILASRDPVAIDQACYDLVLKTGGDVLAKAHPNIDGTLQLAYAEEMGIGSREYELIDV